MEQVAASGQAGTGVWDGGRLRRMKRLQKVHGVVDLEEEALREAQQRQQAADLEVGLF